MKRFNEMYVIGIDHGYGNMKTANCCFSTGVMKSDTEPVFASDLLIWNNKYYSIGVGHKEFTADKFNDEDYYVLTLAAIARELRRERIELKEKSVNEDSFLERVIATIREETVKVNPFGSLLQLVQTQPIQAPAEKEDNTENGETMLDFLDGF